MQAVVCYPQSALPAIMQEERIKKFHAGILIFDARNIYTKNGVLHISVQICRVTKIPILYVY